jgi:hypothetical protein
MSLSLSDLINLCILEAGQYVGELESTLLNETQLALIFKKELAWYSKYFPQVITTSARLYNNKVFSLDNDGFVPDQVLEIKRREVSNYLFGGSRRFGIVASYFWRYDSPRLFFNTAEDLYEITYSVTHKYDEAAKVFPTLNLEDSKFLNLCIAKFMIMLGRSRRSFTTQEFPIMTDGSELVSEGTEMYEKAKESCTSGSDFWLSLIN